MTTVSPLHKPARHHGATPPDFKLALAFVVALSMFAVPALQAQTFTVLHSFTGTATDGAYPSAGVTIRGNALYGTTQEGGDSCGNDHRCGTVYQVQHVGSNWVTTPLFFFPASGSGGTNPISSVVFGPDGHLYGTTPSGGTSNNGVVFTLTPPLKICATLACYWTENVLHSFAGAPDDGAAPGYGHLIWDSLGNAYGTTARGGANSYYGTVFQLTKAGNNWTEFPVYNFGQDYVGDVPQSGLIMDSNGNLFGTTSVDGAYGWGTVFKVSWVIGVGWQATDLYDFAGNGQAGSPYGGLVMDNAGNLYGTTYGWNSAHGTVFELSPSGNTYTFKLLHDFGCMWCGPQANLTMDAAGNLYGTSSGAGKYSAGTVFKLTNTGNGWAYSTLHDFTGGNDGASPISTVTIDTDGTLYGTASVGGTAGGGTVWMIKP